MGEHGSPLRMTCRRLGHGAADEHAAGTGGQPAVSPDGAKIAFASDRSGNFELYELALATGEVKRLTDSRAQNGSPQYSPDGRYLLFDSNRDRNYDVYRLNPSTGGLTQLTRSERPQFNGDPSWRPYGHRAHFRN